MDGSITFLVFWVSMCEWVDFGVEHELVIGGGGGGVGAEISRCQMS